MRSVPLVLSFHFNRRRYDSLTHTLTNVYSYRRYFFLTVRNDFNSLSQLDSISWIETPRSIASLIFVVPAITSNGFRSYSYSYGGSFQRNSSRYMSCATLT